MEYRSSPPFGAERKGPRRRTWGGEVGSCRRFPPLRPGAERDQVMEDRSLPPRAGDIAEYGRFLLLFVETVLHQIADRDDADELALLHHRQVAHAVRRHHLHHM